MSTSTDNRPTKRTIASIREGNVWKKGPHGAPWKIRYLVLWSSKKIEYYQDDTMIHHKGTISLHETTQKDVQRSDKTKPKIGAIHGFVVTTKKRKWYFACAEPKQRDDWIECIRDTVADNAEWKNISKGILTSVQKEKKKQPPPKNIEESTTEEAKEMVPFQTFVTSEADILTETPPEQRILNAKPRKESSSEDSNSDDYDPFETLRKLQKDYLKKEKEKFEKEQIKKESDSDEDISDPDYDWQSSGKKTQAKKSSSEDDAKTLSGQTESDSDKKPEKEAIVKKKEESESADSLSGQTDSDSGDDGGDISDANSRYVRKEKKLPIEELVESVNENEKIVTLYYTLSYYLDYVSDKDGRGMNISRVKKNEYGKQLYIKYGIDGNDNWYIHSINNHNMVYKLSNAVEDILESLDISRGYNVCFMRKDLNTEKKKKNHQLQSLTLDTLKKQKSTGITIKESSKTPFLVASSKLTNYPSFVGKVPNLPKPPPKKKDKMKEVKSLNVDNMEKLFDKKTEAEKMTETIDYGNHKYKHVKLFTNLNNFFSWTTNEKTSKGMYISKLKRNNFGRELFIKYGIDHKSGWYIESINKTNLKDKKRKDIDVFLLSLNVNDGYDVIFRRLITNEPEKKKNSKKKKEMKNKEKKNTQKKDKKKVDKKEKEKSKKEKDKQKNKKVVKKENGASKKIKKNTTSKKKSKKNK